MGTTVQDLSRWFDDGVKDNKTHMIVVCDTYDWFDYPVYVSDDQDVRAVEAHYSKNMQKVMEVYNLKLSKEMQMSERRAFHY